MGAEQGETRRRDVDRITPPAAPCGGDACADVMGQLVDAAYTRDLIGTAKGILMVEGEVDADGAFTALRETSQAGNRKLRDLAADVVSRYDTYERPVARQGQLSQVLQCCWEVRHRAVDMQVDARRMAERAIDMRGDGFGLAGS
jgi:hypothetical protein